MNRPSDDSLRRSVRAIGAFLYLIAFLALACSALPYLMLKPTHELWRHAVVLLLVKLSVFFLILAHSLRKFQPWARVAGIAVSCVGILVFPFGTFVYGPFVYVLVKSKHLFTPPSPLQLPGNTVPSEIDRLAA